MTLQGKGFFTYILPECEGGDPISILAAAQATGLNHIIIKIADAEEAFSVNASGIDLAPLVVQTLHAFGIAVWGWHSIIGNNPLGEAKFAIARTQALGLDGYVVEVKEEYERSGMTDVARQFMTAVRGVLTIPIALSSYRFPDYHPDLPWSTFLEFCDLHMPLVTWEYAHDAGVQLRECKRQCDALPNARPFIPTGAAYTTSGWSPTAEEINDFLITARALDLPAVNFFSWDACRQNLPHLWTTIADFAWPAPTSSLLRAKPPVSPPDKFLAQFLTALRDRQTAQMSTLYDSSATQVWADQIRNGATSIQAGFATFFDSLAPGTIFSISQAQADDNLRTLSWKAGLLRGETTLVLQNGKIILDYTFIS
jgi:hypothetical protein